MCSSKINEGHGKSKSDSLGFRLDEYDDRKKGYFIYMPSNHIKCYLVEAHITRETDKKPIMHLYIHNWW